MEKVPNRHDKYRADQARRARGMTAEYLAGRERILGRGPARYYASRLLDSIGEVREAVELLREVYRSRRSL